MQGKTLSIGLRAVLAIIAATLFVTSTWATAQEKVLYNFGGGTDGTRPAAGLIFDAAGNLYGTTPVGGAYNGCGSVGCGTVFELTPTGREQVLYSFCSQYECTDGANPQAGLIFDAAGNLYGTTGNGGTVFELTPTAGGGWTEQVLLQFNGQNGSSPKAGLIFDAAGNLYGTTGNGGTYDDGIVFELTPNGSGGWTETVLHNFNLNGTDGIFPEAGLIFDAAGNLYGTTSQGGTTGRYGTVFELTPEAGGGWTEQVLHSFGSGTDGKVPLAGLIFDAAGNLYGTTYEGGTIGAGMVFELTPAAGGTWTEQVLLNFNGTDGNAPFAGLIFDAGNLYGTTAYGSPYIYGTVFELKPTAGGGWTEQVLHSFGSGTDGAIPFAGLISDAAGNLYGTTYHGGTNTSCPEGCGTVFEVTAAPKAGTTTTLRSSANPSTVGEPVTFTATVAPAGPPAPTGTVSFTSNGTPISGCTALPLTSSLTAICMTSTLAVGTDAITATYSGDTNYSGSSGTLAQLVNPTPSPLQFVAVAPCRLVDTRPQFGGSGPIQGGTFQSFPIPQEGGCNIPTSAAAYSLNVSVVPQGTLGYLTIWPTGEGRPVVATLNSLDGRIKANAAIVAAGAAGAVSIYVTQTTNVILDIDGYFAPVSGSTLAFYPLTPCRVVDTRVDTFPPGLGPPQLSALTPRDLPVLLSPCIPTGINPAAYSFNFTVVPGGHPVGYLSAWPTGQSQPVVSTLNDQTGTIVANAAIVPAGTGGNISVYSTNDTQLLIDINGYFAPAGPGGLSLYAVAPCRVIDTRHVGSGQPFSGTLTPPVDVVGSFCGPPAAAQAYVFNATVVPTGALGYLTLWPDGTGQPVVSTLNAFDGSLTNNMAIVPTNNGKVDAFANGLTQLILDISSYFAP